MADDVIDTTVELRNCYIVLVEASDTPRNDKCMVCACGTRYCRVGLQYGKNGGERSLYTEQDRAKIGKYAAENGNKLARRKFAEAFPNLKESSVRNFKKLYLQKLDAKRNEQSITSLAVKARGRPPILGDLDDKLVNVLLAIRRKGGTITCHVVRATATALLKVNPSQAARLCTFDMPRTWIVSINKRIGFVRRASTTSRPSVPMGVYQECRLDFLSGINKKMKEHSIPPDFVLNADKTPSTYVSTGAMTMAKRGEKNVAMKGLADKRAITLTFTVSLTGEFLTMQVIYGGKTTANQPRGFKFPDGFCVSQNPKHWLNEDETEKLIDTIINPFAVKKRK